MKKNRYFKVEVKNKSKLLFSAVCDIKVAPNSLYYLLDCVRNTYCLDICELIVSSHHQDYL